MYVKRLLSKKPTLSYKLKNWSKYKVVVQMQIQIIEFSAFYTKIM